MGPERRMEPSVDCKDGSIEIVHIGFMKWMQARYIALLACDAK